MRGRGRGGGSIQPSTMLDRPSSPRGHARPHTLPRTLPRAVGSTALSIASRPLSCSFPTPPLTSRRRRGSPPRRPSPTSRRAPPWTRPRRRPRLHKSGERRGSRVVRTVRARDACWLRYGSADTRSPALSLSPPRALTGLDRPLLARRGRRSLAGRCRVSHSLARSLALPRAVACLVSTGELRTHNARVSLSTAPARRRRCGGAPAARLQVLQCVAGTVEEGDR
jgi:hypothetical protein